MTTVTVPRPAAVAAVLATASTWTSARRKSDGKAFFFVPGSTSGAVYMTAVDGCTCPAAQHSLTGDCKHQVAVRQHQQPAPKPRTALDRLDALYPPCAGGCGDLVERKGERCYPCLSAETHRLEQDRKRALLANL